MQTVKVTRDYIFSAACTLPVLMEIATKYCGYSQKAAENLAKQGLKQGTEGSGLRSNGVNNLDAPKLRTVVVQKLQDSTDYGDTFKTNELQLDIDCLADMDINQAGANKAKQQRRTSQKLTGEYVVAKKGLKCDENSDPEKFKIWKHIWDSNTFEQYFEVAPKKGVTKTGRVITAASEMGWAVKCGWVVPKAIYEQQQAEAAAKKQ